MKYKQKINRTKKSNIIKLKIKLKRYLFCIMSLFNTFVGIPTRLFVLVNDFILKIYDDIKLDMITILKGKYDTYKISKFRFTYYNQMKYDLQNIYYKYITEKSETDILDVYLIIYTLNNGKKLYQDVKIITSKQEPITTYVERRVENTVKTFYLGNKLNDGKDTILYKYNTICKTYNYTSNEDWLIKKLS